MNEFDSDHNTIFRHKVGNDCVSILETDAATDQVDDNVLANHEFVAIVRQLKNDRDRFVAACLAQSFQKKDIAYMIGIHPSRVSRVINRIRKTLIKIGYD